jgi:hypothetical protein
MTPEGHSAPIYRRHSLYEKEFGSDKHSVRRIVVYRKSELGSSGVVAPRFLSLQWSDRTDGGEVRLKKKELQVNRSSAERMANAAEALESNVRQIERVTSEFQDSTEIDDLEGLGLELHVAKDGSREFVLRGSGDVIFRLGDRAAFDELVAKVGG